MSGITGIELGPDSCVLVQALQRREAIELSAAHVIDPSAWPSDATRAADLLNRIRREKRLPSKARVVCWALAGGASPTDAAIQGAVRPLTDAGFRVEAIMPPQQALAALAARRSRGAGASAWVAINRKGAAIAIVRGTETLYSRAFSWNWESAAIGSQAHLLQRYSIVAHLAPEVRRGIQSVRAKYGLRVESVVTCGDLPDLRSLTMPLIEELDVEVETLDSSDGLVLPASASRDQFPEPLSALRLASAAAVDTGEHASKAPPRQLVPAAVVLIAVSGLVWAAYAWWNEPEPVPATATGAPAIETARPPQESTPARTGAAASGPVNAPTRTTGVAEKTPVAADAPPSARANANERATPRPPARTPRTTGLKDPLPVIDTILVSSDRRIAVVDGAILGVGDVVGRRTIVRIEPDSVYLKEPSGLEIRVPIKVRR